MFFIYLKDDLGVVHTINVANIVSFCLAGGGNIKAAVSLSNGAVLYTQETPIAIMAQINRVTGRV